MSNNLVKSKKQENLQMGNKPSNNTLKNTR